MTNEEYQRLLRARPAELRERLPGDGSRTAGSSSDSSADLDDDELAAAVRDLGGHDLADLLDAFRARGRGQRPARRSIFAYTIKALAAADAGTSREPLGAAVSAEQWEQLAADARRRRRATRGRASTQGSAEAELCRRGRGAAAARAAAASPPRAVPRELGRRTAGNASTQQAFGRFFVDLAHAAPEVAARVVTVSPDVASSTNLGGWINRAGVWNIGERIDWFADDADTLVRWRESSARPAHRARHRRGQPRRPARRARRDLVARRPAAAADRHALRPVRQPRAGAVVVRHLRGRAVDPRRHAVRRHARARRRRAPVDHHAVGRARAAALRRLGAGLRPGPRVDAARCARRASAQPDGTLRLLPPEHAPDRPGARAQCPTTRTHASSGAAQALAGGYLLRRRERAPRRRRSSAMGAVMPEVLAAADELGGRRHRGRRRLPHLAPISCSARCRRARASATAARHDPRRALPAGAPAPIVTVLDGHPHTLAFLSARSDAYPIACLGVDGLRPVRRRRGPLPPLRHRRRDDRRRRARPASMS